MSRAEVGMKRKFILVIIIASALLLAGSESALGKKTRHDRRAARVKKQKLSKTKVALGRGSRRSGAQISRRARRGRRLARRHRTRRSLAEDQTATAAATPRSASGIPAERITEIQSALGKLGYFNGPTTGQYDDATIEAMKQFQSDNGFSATGWPSAHALKKLGVSKNSNDGYSAPVKRVSQADKQLL
jgi:putative peptidoglycan binding protein